MKKLDIYKAAISTALDTLDIEAGPKLEAGLSAAGVKLNLNDADYTLFYNSALSIRNNALAHRKADEMAAKQPAPAKPVAHVAKAVALLIGLVCLLFASSATAQVISATNSITYQTVTAATTNGVTINLGAVTLPSRTHVIQHAGLATTNALQVIDEISLDGSNWASLSTNYMATTNATTYSWKPSTVNATLYRRAKVITTNAVTVGVTTVRYQ